MTITPNEIKAITAGIADVVTERLRELNERIEKLERAEAPTLADSFKGGWLSGESYERGDLCQKSGGLWLCLADTSDAPGNAPEWRALGKI